MVYFQVQFLNDFFQMHKITLQRVISKCKNDKPSNKLDRKVPAHASYFHPLFKIFRVATEAVKAIKAVKRVFFETEL